MNPTSSWPWEVGIICRTWTCLQKNPNLVLPWHEVWCTSEDFNPSYDFSLLCQVEYNSSHLWQSLHKIHCWINQFWKQIRDVKNCFRKLDRLLSLGQNVQVFPTMCKNVRESAESSIIGVSCSIPLCTYSWYPNLAADLDTWEVSSFVLNSQDLCWMLQNVKFICCKILRRLRIMCLGFQEIW